MIRAGFPRPRTAHAQPVPVPGCPAAGGDATGLPGSRCGSGPPVGPCQQAGIRRLPGEWCAAPGQALEAGSSADRHGDRGAAAGRSRLHRPLPGAADRRAGLHQPHDPAGAAGGGAVSTAGG